MTDLCDRRVTPLHLDRKLGPHQLSLGVERHQAVDPEELGLCPEL